MENKVRVISARILTIAFPVMVQGLVFQIQSLTDKAFLGNIDAIYLSALGAAQFPLNTTLDSVVALGTGITIIVSRLYGDKRSKSVIGDVKSTLLFNSILSIFLFIIWCSFTEDILHILQVNERIMTFSKNYIMICSGYILLLGIDSSLQAMLQGLGDTRPIMYAGVLKVILNICISWVLIFGHFGFSPMYIDGAAIGTLVANLISAMGMIVYCFVWKKDVFQLHKEKRLWFSWRPFARVIRLGMPTALEFLLWNASNLVLIRFLNGFSYLATTIYTLTFGIEVIIYAVFNGISRATLIIMGQEIGACDKKKANIVFRVSVGLNLIIVGIAICIFILFTKPILMIFTKDIKTISETIPFLMITGIIMIPKSLNVIIGSAIRANQDTRFMLFSQMVGSTFVIACSFAMVQIFHLHMIGIYITLFLDEAIRAMVNGIHYSRCYGDKKDKTGTVKGDCVWMS